VERGNDLATKRYDYFISRTHSEAQLGEDAIVVDVEDAILVEESSDSGEEESGANDAEPIQAAIVESGLLWKEGGDNRLMVHQWRIERGEFSSDKETEEDMEVEATLPQTNNNNNNNNPINSNSTPIVATAVKKTRIHRKYLPETKEEEWFQKWLHQHAPVVSGREKERRLIWCTYVKSFTFYKHEAATLGMLFPFGWRWFFGLVICFGFGFGFGLALVGLFVWLFVCLFVLTLRLAH
jgi:hypothetical protein